MKEDVTIHDLDKERQRPYTVIFYGGGNVTYESLKQLVCDQLYPRLAHIVLTGRNAPRLEVYLKESGMIAGQKFSTADRKIVVQGELQNPALALEDALKLAGDDPKVVVFTASAMDPKKRSPTSRGIEFEKNLAPLRGIKHLLNDYRDNLLVHIVSNPPEPLAYVLADETEIHPRRITGSCEIDRMRLWSLMLPRLRDRFDISGNDKIIQLNAFVVGTHSRPHALLDSLHVEYIKDGKKESDDFSIRGEEEFRLRDELTTFARRQNEGMGDSIQAPFATTTSTGAAVLEYLKVLHNGGIMNLSVPFSRDNIEPCYAALPATIRGGYAYQVLFDELLRDGTGKALNVKLDKTMCNVARKDDEEALKLALDDELKLVREKGGLGCQTLTLERIVDLPESLEQRCPNPAKKYHLLVGYCDRSGDHRSGFRVFDEGLNLIEEHLTHSIRSFFIAATSQGKEVFIGTCAGIERRGIDELSKIVRAYNIPSGAESHINSMALLGNHLIAGCSSIGLLAYDMDRRDPVVIYEGKARHVTPYHDDCVLFSAGNTLHSLTIEKNQHLVTGIQKFPARIKALATHGKQIIVTLDDGTLFTYSSLDLHQAAYQTKVPRHIGELAAIKRHGKLLAGVASISGCITLVDQHNNSSQQYVNTRSAGRPVGLVATPDHLFLADSCSIHRWHYTQPLNPYNKQLPNNTAIGVLHDG